jgi:4-amino-4-deoxychorismate lyase
MSLLFETIRIEDGSPRNLEWHERRMNSAILEQWNVDSAVSLGPLIRVPAEFSKGMVRCNIRYGPEITGITYRMVEKRVVRSLKLVICDDIDYHVKFDDRSRLEALLVQRGECDEILVVKDGFITDTSMSNIIVFDGTKWVTPAGPLLKGTCRERLISEGRLEEQWIRPSGLAGFAGWKLINALREPEEEMMIPVSQIFH